MEDRSQMSDASSRENARKFETNAASMNEAVSAIMSRQAEHCETQVWTSLLGQSSFGPGTRAPMLAARAALLAHLRLLQCCALSLQMLLLLHAVHRQ